MKKQGCTNHLLSVHADSSAVNVQNAQYVQCGRRRYGNSRGSVALELCCYISLMEVSGLDYWRLWDGP
ncbi:unnamed protein product [Urochloa humidicola]